MKRQILFFINLVLVMLVTGVFWGTWFTLTRSLDVFPADNFIRIGKTIIDNVAWPMRILMPATLLSLLWLCLITAKHRPSIYFFAGAFLLMLVTLLNSKTYANFSTEILLISFHIRSLPFYYSKYPID